MKVSIIIPAYNEEKTIGITLERVLDLEGVTDKEIIVVDDGSKDKTIKVVEDLKKGQKEIRLIKCRVNKGKGRAVVKGIEKAKGDIIVIQDADLEYHPKDIPRLIKPILTSKARVVYGTRLKMKPKLIGKNKTPFILHFFGNKMLSKITSLLYGHEVSDMETGYKAFHKSVLKGIKLKSKSFNFEPEITAKILKKHIKIKEINIKTNPRGYEEGKKIRTFRDGMWALWTLAKYRVTD